jgi:hypothetical protein
MENKKKQIEEAESLMQPGYFHHAVSKYEALGMKEKAKEASIKCAADCLQNYRIAFAIKYLNKAGKKDIASKVKEICDSLGLVPNEDLEMRGCMMGFCSDYVDKAISISESKEAKSLIDKLK